MAAIKGHHDDRVIALALANIGIQQLGIGTSSSSNCKAGRKTVFGISEIKWGDVANHALTGVAGVAAASAAFKFNEFRRRICLSAIDVSFGAAQNYNLFLGRNCPHEDVIALDCEIRLFSNKTLQTGLHNFHIEFCQRTIFGSTVVLTFDHKQFHRNLLEKDDHGPLETLVLPPRQFVCFTLTLHLHRKYWPDLHECDHVRMTCQTPEGSVKRFFISEITFPTMPDEGPRGR